MRRLAVPVWTSVVITLAGIWTAVVPFIWPAITGLFTMSRGSMMMHAASSTGMAMGLSASTFIYHIIPGGAVAILGLYQLTAAHIRATRPSSSVESEQKFEGVQATH
jgi:uncharacterized membrane protein YqhA